MIKYNFVSNFDQTNEIDVRIPFYQICTFANPKTKKHELKKFVVNKNNEFVSAKKYFISEKNYSKFLKIKKPNEYKLYSVYNLDGISNPSPGDISLLMSTMASDNYDYYGSAPF